MRALPPLPRLPSLCAVCRDWSLQGICRHCVARFAPTSRRCTRCALPVPEAVDLCGDCVRQPPPFARAVAAVDYGFPWDGLVRQFKFQGAVGLAPPLAALIASALGEAPATALLLPLPLAPRRLAERGFNQAALLARALGRRLGLPVEARVLRRAIETPQLSGLPRELRAKAVRGAFAIDARRASAIDGRDVALVDDVMTTGATAAEASRVLLSAGAASVELWLLARTPAPA